MNSSGLNTRAGHAVENSKDNGISVSVKQILIAKGDEYRGYYKQELSAELLEDCMADAKRKLGKVTELEWEFLKESVANVLRIFGKRFLRHASADTFRKAVLDELVKIDADKYYSYLRVYGSKMS